MEAQLEPVDAYALPDESYPEKFYDSVVELRYAAQQQAASEEEPAAKRQRAEQADSGAAEAATQPKQCFRIAASAMSLARASEKFKRALHPDWSGTVKVLALDIDDGELEVYRHLLHNLHMAGMPKPWLPDGASELVTLLEVAGREMVTITVLGCAKALAAKAADLSQDEAAKALTAGLHSETDDEEGQAALATLRQSALDRLVALLSPLEQFWTSLLPPATSPVSGRHVLPLTGPVLLPREVLELVLGSDSLKVESEETVLATALAWLQRNAGDLDEEDRREHAVQLLSRVRWGLVQASIAAGALQCSELLRAFDPHRQLVCFLLLGKQLPENSVWWSRFREQHPQKWWQERRGSLMAASIEITFQLQVVITRERARYISYPLFKKGVFLSLHLGSPNEDGPELQFILEISFEHMDAARTATSPAEGSPPSLLPSALAFPLECSLAFERSDGAPRVPVQLPTAAVALMHTSWRAFGCGFRFPLSRLGRDRVGQPLTATSLMGPHSPFMHEDGLRVHAHLSFI